MKEATAGTNIIDEKRKRVFLVGIRDDKMSPSEADSLAKELSSLVETLELEIVSREMIRIRKNHAKFGMGTGNAQSLADKAALLKPDCIIFDREISPSQQRNWEEFTGIPVMDRQELIIQIFASRAKTREAELQVRLAELVYSLPRLRHKYVDLSRQRGGRYGTRGSGETRLETDRRLVEKQIEKLEEELEAVKRQRQVQRRQRERQAIPICALVGYTNAGKSSIFNALTGAGVLAEDRLFATLDSTTRRLMLPSGLQVLLVDTVGFIRRLPHGLIKAFRSTLEEVNRASLILIILDAADPDTIAHYETTLSVLAELEAGSIPMITVLNKVDKLESCDTVNNTAGISQKALEKLYPESISVSAKNATGLKELCMRIESTLASLKLKDCG